MVDDPRFYANIHVYFNGLWAQAGEASPGQQALLKILADLAEHPGGLPLEVWRGYSGLDPATFDAVLDALKHHEVVCCGTGVCRYRVELMRRWVAAGVTGRS